MLCPLPYKTKIKLWVYGFQYSPAYKAVEIALPVEIAHVITPLEQQLQTAPNQVCKWELIKIRSVPKWI